MDKKIVWEKWYDPLKSSIDDYKSVISDAFDEHMAHEHVPAEMVLDRAFPVRGPILLSNMGPIPIHEGNTPDKIFKFWIAHTNFNITEEVHDKICKVPGVEVCNVWSRYRFRLGVGKAFTDREVMGEIDRIITGKQTILEGKALVDYLADNLKKKKREFYITSDGDNQLLFVDHKPKGVDTIYDWNQKKHAKKGSSEHRAKGSDEERG